MNKKQIDRMLANLPGVERREISGIINQLEAYGARLGIDDVRAFVNMTDQQRANFLGFYQRN